VPTLVVGTYAPFGTVGGDPRDDLHGMGTYSIPAARRGPDEGRIHRDQRRRDVCATRHFSPRKKKLLKFKRESTRYPLVTGLNFPCIPPPQGVYPVIVLSRLVATDRTYRGRRAVFAERNKEARACREKGTF
jgi:hypothetical protein